MFSLRVLAISLLASRHVCTTRAQTCNSFSEQVSVTFYGWPDNDPPGSGISCELTQRTNCNTCSPSNTTTTTRQCGPRGETAGGDGSFANPLTMASSGTWFCHQEVVYLPFIRKYVRYEDYCQQCIDDARKGAPVHIDLWTGSNTETGGRLQIMCENTLTPSGRVEMVRNPGAGLVVDTSNLFTKTGNGTGLCNGTPVSGDTDFGQGTKGAASTVLPPLALCLSTLMVAVMLS